MTTTRIAIVGTGYVGLTTGACLAQLGHDVTCADVDEEKVATLSAGVLPIHEPGLEHIVRENVAGGRLRFVLGAASAVPDREIVYLCVPTPPAADGSADLSSLRTAVTEVAGHLSPGAVVVNKSTVPVGTTRLVEEILGRPDVQVVSNPEFLREGSAVVDFLDPDRVVVGADDRAAAARVAALYVGTRAPILITDPRSAETIKYAANAFLATKLSFVNDIAGVCEAVGADVYQVLLGIGYDRRIGHEFLQPGPGWGGSCFPKDTRAMIRIAEGAGYDFALLRSAVIANERQFDRVADKIAAAAGDDLDGVPIGVLGLTFKAGTDDVRESPALRVIDRLLARGARVRAYDPTVDHRAFDGFEVVDDPYAACEGARVLAVLTEWDEFKWLDFDKVAETMAGRMVVDGRNILERDALSRCGLECTSIGRG